jgi:hypothetical protein
VESAPSPVHRGAQPFEHAVDRGNLDILRPLGVGLEPIDFIRLLERRQRQVSEVLFEDTDLASH